MTISPDPPEDPPPPPDSASPDPVPRREETSAADPETADASGPDEENPGVAKRNRLSEPEEPEEAQPQEEPDEPNPPPPKLRQRLRRGWKWAWRGGAGLFLLSLLAVVPWRWIPLPTTAFMVREHIVEDHEAIAYRWVPMEEISPHLAIAAVASEDQLFPEHHGFDLKAIAEALEDDHGRRRGASTISQQVVKNLYLWPGRSYLRKGLEAYLTVLVETTWPKRRILEVYLNVAELGPGVFGAEAAAQAFYGKGAQDLSLYEASLLGAVLPNPKGRSAASPSPYVTRRAAAIRRQVSNLGGAGYLEDL